MTLVGGGEQVARAVELLASGGLVAFPTETVYGLGADATNPAAVRRVFEAKGRPAGHPLIVHVGHVDAIERWADRPDPRARQLVAAFWPGPLTVIVPSSGSAVPEVTGGRGTVGLRMPDHPLTLELLQRFDGGLVGPSANRFGHVSPTTAGHVLDDLDGRLDLVLDGGPARVGLESTIVEVLVGQPPTLLRPGGISVGQLEQVLGEPIVDGRTGPSRAAGMLASHYAPHATVEIVDVADARSDGVPNDIGVAVISAIALDHPDVTVLSNDAGRFGAGLYEALRAIDARGMERIVIVPPTDGVLLPAVLDRLSKAAGPRS